MKLKLLFQSGRENFVLSAGDILNELDDFDWRVIY